MRARIILLLVALVALSWTARGADDTAWGVRVVVLDAGHGGNDPGACYGGVREKDLTLKVVTRLGKMIQEQMPGVKVVYTRTSDKALAPTKIEDLQKRADLANRAEGDLFISVHVNAAKSTAAKGVETLIMGETPKEQQYNENALFDTNRDDLLDMSDEREAAIVRAYIQNLQFTYGQYSEAMARCIQQNYTKIGRHSRGVKRQPLRVLYATNMPGVLTEIGFLSNKEEAAFLKSEKGINRLVQSLYQSVRDYSNYVLEARRVEEQPLSESEVAEAVKPTPAPAASAAPKAEEKKVATSEETKTPTPPKKEAQPLYDARLYRGGATATAAKKPSVQQTSTPEAASTPATKKSSEKAAPKQPAKRFYTVQVLASKRELSMQSADFKKYRGRVCQYKSTGAYPYKYGVGEYTTRAEALKAAVAVRKSFPQAFVVAVEDGRAVTPKQ